MSFLLQHSGLIKTTRHLEVTEKDVARADRHLRLIYLIMMLDFVVTWYGIHQLGFIEEANIFMLWAFEIPFELSFALRCMLIYPFLRLGYLVNELGDTPKYLFINHVVLSVYVIIMLMHLHWNVLYLFYSG